jgi:hypothetical protein
MVKDFYCQIGEWLVNVVEDGKKYLKMDGFGAPVGAVFQSSMLVSNHF